ncbi:TPA: BppU family phage baseplate upper protein [Enterococcus faecium]
MVYKMNESIIVIRAEATKPNDTNVVFWSHDRGTAKLRMKLVRKNGIPQSLPEGTTVPIRLIFKSATTEGGYGKHDYLATIEDRVNGIVSIVLEDNILGYVGKVEGSVYIDFPDDRSLDTAGRFTFDIKRSPIDDSTPELENYYFNGFSQTIDKIEKILADGKQEIEQKITESETQIDGKLKDTNDKIMKANQDVVTLNTNIDKANDRIDQTNQQIGDLSKLKKMYSNSIDFGDYDYSGNPNLMRIVKASDFHLEGDTVVTDVSTNAIYVMSKGAERLNTFTSNNTPSLISGKTYTISAKVKVDEGTTGDIDKIRIAYRKTTNGTILLSTTAYEIEVGKEITVKATGVVNYEITDLSRFYLTIDLEGYSSRINGGVIISDIKIEEGPTATPYQPNLLVEPWSIGKVPLGDNIKDKGTVFPIKTRAYAVYSGANTEPYIAGQKYTLTMKATKPATQTFNVFLDAGTIGVGSMTPVDGLTDVWQKTFTVSQANIDAGVTNRLAIYQVPNSSVGAVQIDWLKIEKGNTRTPNIEQYKYFGEGLKDSNNPNDYSWDITPEYTEKGLNDSVSLTKPQSVDGTKNFLETPLVNGKNVLVEEKPLPYEAWHSTGTEQTGISNKARLIIGPVATTIGAKLNRSMKENPLTWNSGNWQATANRDCTLLVEGLVRYQFGGSTAGQYGYITFYKDDAQTSSIGFAGGVGINGTALQWKHGLHFSRIFALKKGEYFNITFETQDGKKLDFSQINTLHIMEIES